MRHAASAFRALGDVAPISPRVTAPDSTSPRPEGLRACLWLAASVVLCRLLAALAFPIYDDAFITYRYAQNFAAGAGLVYNPGAAWEPVLGTTTPLYALLLGLLGKCGAPVASASLAFNLLCDGCSAWLLARALRARPWAAWIAVAAFAASPHLGRISVGGMEPPLFVALALGAASSAASGRLALSGLLAALACTTRPEGVLLVAAVFGCHVRSWRDAARFLAPVALVGCLSAGILTVVYGSPIAQSVRAKAGRHGLGFDFARAAATALQAFAPSRLSQWLGPFALFGLARALRREAALRSFLLFACAIPVAYIASGAKTWGWYFYAPLTASCIALGVGAGAALDWARARPRANPLLARVEPFAPYLAGVLAIAAAGALALWKPDPITPTVYASMQARFAEEDLPAANARLLASDIGAVGYFSRATILDSEGLVWPPAREYPDQGAALEALRPEYFLVVANQLRMRAFTQHPVHASYTPIARFNATDESELQPRWESLPNGWVQDYILYRRSDYTKRTE